MREATTKSGKHYGLAMIRALMSFVVVTCHFWATPTRYSLINYLDLLKPLAVPVFMLTSFFLRVSLFLIFGPIRSNSVCFV